MCPQKKTFLFVVFIFNFAFGFSQDLSKQSSIEHTLKTISNDSIESDFLKDYTIDDYTVAVDIAIKMSNDGSDLNIEKKGVNLMATLAKSFTKLVKAKKVDLDNTKVQSLLKSFENEKYYIEKPKVSRFIKLMNYMCKGEYVYVHHKLIWTRAYKMFWVLVFLYLSIFLFSYSNKFNWKHEKKFRKFTIYSFAFLILLFIIFKSTCHDNIKDYSFYGISI